MAEKKRERRKLCSQEAYPKDNIYKLMPQMQDKQRERMKPAA